MKIQHRNGKIIIKYNKRKARRYIRDRLNNLSKDEIELRDTNPVLLYATLFEEAFKIYMTAREVIKHGN